MTMQCNRVSTAARWTFEYWAKKVILHFYAFLLCAHCHRAGQRPTTIMPPFNPPHTQVVTAQLTNHNLPPPHKFRLLHSHSHTPDDRDGVFRFANTQVQATTIPVHTIHSTYTLLYVTHHVAHHVTQTIVRQSLSLVFRTMPTLGELAATNSVFQAAVLCCSLLLPARIESSTSTGSAMVSGDTLAWAL